MADPQTTTTTTTSGTTGPAFTPLSIPDFATKIRSYNPTQLTPEVVDDATLVRKTLERKPELMKYVQTSEPRPQLRRGREPQAAAADQIRAIFQSHNVEFKPENLDKLPWKDRFQVLAVVSKMFAQESAGEWKEAKGWREKLHSVVGTLGGVSMHEMGTIFSGVADKKNLAIGATGVAIDPLLPAAWFLFEGGTRLPGEAQRLIKDPSFENIMSFGNTAIQVIGSVGAMGESTGTGIGTGIVGGPIKRGLKAGTETADVIRASRGNPEIAERIVADARKAKDAYDAQVQHIEHTYGKDVAKREQAMAEATADYVEKIAKAREEWVKNTSEAHHARKGAAMIEAHRQKLESSSKAMSKVADDNVKNVEKLEHADLDQQFNAVRKQLKIEDKTDEHPAVYPQLNADALRNRVREARQMLQGAPEDLKAFNDLIKQMAKEKGEGVEEGGGGRVDVSDPGTEFSLNWDEGRTQSSALGRASASESISGNVRRAIRWVLGDVTAKLVDGKMEKTYTGLEGELQRVADEKGAGKAYTNARLGWRQYMEDWHDMSGEKGGGSPLARALRAKDLAIIQDELKGKAGDRLIELFAKRTKYGASPKNLAKLRNMDMELASLPKAEYVPEPGKMVRPEAPKTPEPVATVGERVEDRLAAGTLKEPPTPEQMMEQLKEAKRLHARDVGRGALKIKMHDVTMGALTAAHIFGKYNSLYAIGYVTGRLGWAVTANLKDMQDYIAKITPQDIEAINKAYVDDPAGKAELQKAVTEGFIKGAATERKPLLAKVIDSKTLGKLLSPAQMGRVLRAYTPYGQKPEQHELNIAPTPESPMEVTPISQNAPRGDLQPPTIWAELHQLVNRLDRSVSA